MSRLNITVDTWDPLTGLDRGTLRTVWIRAANKAIAKAKTQASKLVRAEYFLKAEDMRNVLKVYRAKPSDLTAALRARSRRLSLARFQVRQKAAGVQVRVKRSGRGDVLAHTFLSVLPLSRLQVRSREGKGRYPTIQHTGPSPADLIGSEEIFVRLDASVRDDMGTIYNHELGFELQRQGQKAPRK